MHISSRCSIAVHCLLFIHEYSPLTKVTGNLISTSTKTNPAATRSILGALKKAGILEIKSGTGGAALAVPPEKISLLQVYEAVEPDFAQKLIGVHENPSTHCPVGSCIHDVLDLSYEKVRTDLRESLSRITLADVIANYHNIDRDPSI